MSVETPTDPPQSAERRAATRRAFLGSVARKATFVVPVVMTLKAQTAFAAGSRTTSCIASGVICTTDDECCSGNCVAAGMFCAMGV